MYVLIQSLVATRNKPTFFNVILIIPMLFVVVVAGDWINDTGSSRRTRMGHVVSRLVQPRLDQLVLHR